MASGASLARTTRPSGQPVVQDFRDRPKARPADAQPRLFMRWFVPGAGYGK